jgi:hypothetical protein
MTSAKSFRVLAVLLSAALMLAAPAPVRADGGSGQSSNALVGTWNLVLTFSDGTQAKSTLTVIPGRDAGEGSVIHAAEASLLRPNPTTPEQGAWAHVRGRRFIASYQGYAVDSAFQAPAGKIGFRHSLLVGPDRETFSGDAIFEVLDPSGAVVFSDRIKTTGTRQRVTLP